MPRLRGKIIDTGMKYIHMNEAGRIHSTGPGGVIVVVNRDTNTLVYQIVEVNVEEGWLTRLRDEIPMEDGQYITDQWPIETIHGNFMIGLSTQVEVGPIKEVFETSETPSRKEH